MDFEEITLSNSTTKTVKKKPLLSYLIIFTFCIFSTLSFAQQSVDSEAKALQQVRGLDFYYNISTWFGDQLAGYYRTKILTEADHFQWTPVSKVYEKSAPKMFYDKNKMTPDDTNGVEFWGLEESSSELTDEGGIVPRPSVAYRYHFNCTEPQKSKLLYAVKFSGSTGNEKIILIDTHFNGHWRRSGNEAMDQTLANFKPFLNQACGHD
jgi:hypothetical protein